MTTFNVLKKKNWLPLTVSVQQQYIPAVQLYNCSVHFNVLLLYSRQQAREDRHTAHSSTAAQLSTSDSSSD